VQTGAKAPGFSPTAPEFTAETDSPLTKRRTTAHNAERGGAPFSRGHLYRLLSNPIYTGRIAHKGHLYSGQHPALIA